MTVVTYRGTNRFVAAVQEHGVLLACAWLLPLAIAIGIAYRHGQAVGLERVERTLDGRINSHRQYLSQMLGRYWLIPDVVASSREVRQLVADPSQRNVELVNNSLYELAERTRADRIYVIDETGTTLAANARSGEKSIIGENYRFRPYFRDAMAGITGHFVGIGINIPDISYYLSKPIFVDGTVRGVATLRISLSRESFRSLVQKYWQDNSEIALITDDNGVIFMSPSEKWSFKTIGTLTSSARDEIRNNRQYGNKILEPLEMKIDSRLNDDMRFVRFADIPGRQFVQKSYDMAEFGGRTYMHVDAWVYWEPILTYTVMTAVAGIAFLLVGTAAMQRWLYQKRLVQAAFRDPLTALYTRLYMNEWITQAVQSCMRDRTAGFALVLLDIDRFKHINDNYGHLAGDAVLRETARIILDSIRGDDIAVRFGGEELAVFVRCQGIDDAAVFAERMRKRLAESPMKTEAGTLSITVSAGVAAYRCGETCNDLFARADKLLYSAKRNGRNQICVERTVGAGPAAMPAEQHRVA